MQQRKLYSLASFQLLSFHRQSGMNKNQMNQKLCENSNQALKKKWCWQNNPAHSHPLLHMLFYFCFQRKLGRSTEVYTAFWTKLKLQRRNPNRSSKTFRYSAQRIEPDMTRVRRKVTWIPSLSSAAESHCGRFQADLQASVLQVVSSVNGTCLTLRL